MQGFLEHIYSPRGIIWFFWHSHPREGSDRAPPKARMFPMTCLILLIPLCQSSHVESRLPGLLSTTPQLSNPWKALLSSYSAPALLPHTQQHIPALGIHPLSWAPKPGWVCCLETENIHGTCLDRIPVGSSLEMLLLVVGCSNRRALSSSGHPARARGTGGAGRGGAH